MTFAVRRLKEVIRRGVRESGARRSMVRWVAVLVLMMGVPWGRAEILLGSDITDNVSPLHLTPDALLTVRAYANSNATVAANLGQAGDWFGVVPGNPSAVDGTECLTFQFGTNASLFRLGHRWTRSRIILSGFASDPGFTDPAGHAQNVSYANGTLTYFLNWDDGAERVVTFLNAAASAGRTVRMNVYDTEGGWQATVTRIAYLTGAGLPAVADLAAVEQTMDNFSASDAWSMQNVGLWSVPNRTRLADLLFRTNNGIGLSAWRFNLAAGFDPTVQAGSPQWQPWRTANGFLVASNSYDWNRQPGQRWFLGAAKERGVDQFVAMVYSPPTNFTRNGHVYGTDGLGSSNLKPGYEAAFAQFMGDVLARFATNPVTAERVTFDYVMPVNEPAYEWNSTSQEGCRHANDDILAIIQALRPALDARGLSTDIVVAEAGTLPTLHQTQSDISSKYGKTYGNYLDAFDSVTNLLAPIASAHSYFTDDPATQLVPVRQTLRAELDANPHWRYWQSEYCVLEWGRDLSMTTALNVARVMWADLAIANATAWHWWLSLSQADYKDGLLYTDYWQPGDAETLYCSKNFWAFGQWSRFIRPGWKRVNLPGHDHVFGLMAAAFVDPATNEVAMVFVNQSGTNQIVAPMLDNLPDGKAVSTWRRWITSAAPSDNLSPLPPVVPGQACFIPSNAVMTMVASLANVTSAAAPSMASIGAQNVTTGQVAQVVATITDADTPGALVTVTAYSDNPSLLPPAAISVSASLSTGTLTREVFTNFTGNGIEFLAAAPSFPNAPASVSEVGLFEAPQGVGGTYGSRLCGFVVPPQSGDFTFWIASRDASELYLSASEDPARKTRIARVTQATAPREWTAEATQQSAPVNLTAGRRYYIEAVHTAANGADHLSVGWQLPNATLERPIPGLRLVPWTDPFTNTVRRQITMSIPAAATGSATVFVVATDPLGKSATNQFSVTVVTNYTRPTAVVSGDATLCSGGSTLIQAALAGSAPWTLTWSDGFTQTTNGSLATRLVSPVGSTVYTLTALTDNHGPALAPDFTGSATVTVPRSPLSWAGGNGDWNQPAPGPWNDGGLFPTAYCDGKAVLFDDTATGVSPLVVTLNSAVNPASISVSSSNDFLISGSGSIGGAGTTLTKSGPGRFTLAVTCGFGGPVTIADGTLEIGNGGTIGTLPNNVPVVNNGVLAWNRSTPFTWTAPAAGVTGTGIVRQDGAGKLLLNGDNMLGYSGSQPEPSLVVSSGRTIETLKFMPVGAVSLAGGTLSAAGGYDATYQSWVLTRGVRTEANAASSIITNSGANSGIHLLSGTVFDVADGPATDDLVVPARLINPPPQYGGVPGGLRKLGPGRMVLSGLNTYTGATAVSNGALIINGSVTSPVSVAGGGVLGGSGTIQGNAIILVGGVLSPGISLGTLAVNGTLTLGGTSLMQLNRNLAPSNDAATVSGTLSFGGTLTVTNLGPALKAGDTFKLFNKAGAGAFMTNSLPALDDGLVWTNKLSLNGTIEVVPTTNPDPTNLTAVVSGTNLVLSWPASHRGWSLQAQTNLLSSGLGVAWFTLPGSSATNVWVVPLNSTNPTVFYRMTRFP